MDYKLTIELVPETCWFTNLRSVLSRKDWDTIRKDSYNKAHNKCEICKDVGTNQGVRHNVECHEIWDYDDINKIQYLKGVISLCPKCHKVKHPGLAGLKGETHIVIEQLMKVNNISRNEANKYLNESFNIFEERSKYNWILNIDWLKNNYPKIKNDKFL